MTRIPKIFALLAFLTAAGCRDSYPSVVPPLDILYFPVGMTVRQMPPDPTVEAKKYGWSQLVVLNSNFDLRYDLSTGGTVLVVDPDQSQDHDLGGQLAVVGSLRVGSFGGEIALVDRGCLPGWPDCPSACSTLIADPVVGSGGAKLVFASRSAQLIYVADMDASGPVSCGTNCTSSLPIQQLDPYGVSTVCGTRVAGAPVAYAYVSHLLGANNLGYLSRVNLLADPAVEQFVQPMIMGADGTYTTVFNPVDDRLFVSSSISISPQFRWFNPFVSATQFEGFLVPNFSGGSFSTFMSGAVARDMAISRDGLTLYVSVQLYDLAVAAQTGIIYTQGGAVAAFDLAPSAFGEPQMNLKGVTRTCLGSGQIRRLPSQGGRPELLAITCDLEGGLALYDAKSQTLVRYVGLDPTTGLPVLGRYPFGIAAEPIDPRRATVQPQGSAYAASPCVGATACTRIYVGSFIDNWVNVLELDPDRPSQVVLVKRIGRGP